MTTRLRDVFHMEVDMEGLKQLKKNIQSLNSNHIEWGILNQEQYPADDRKGRAGVYVAEVAKDNEFGFMFSNQKGETHETPPRPFFTQSILVNGKFVAQSSTNLLLSKLPTISIPELKLGMQMLAEKLADTVREEIDSQDFVPNSPETLKRKEGDQILKDSDVMYHSFTGKVVRGKVPLGDS